MTCDQDQMMLDVVDDGCDRRTMLRTGATGLLVATGAVTGLALFGADPAEAVTIRRKTSKRSGGVIYGRTSALRSVGSLSIPRINLTKSVYAGITSRVLNQGVIGYGLWTAPLGTSGHTQLFGHRTSHGGVFRNLHKLRIGDSIIAGGLDYKVRKIEVISAKQPKKIWNYDGSGPRLTLVACSKANGMPTSTKYRICIRASV